jgi:hypothetical protein
VCTPASTVFFATSMPMPLQPTISTFIPTILAITSRPKAPIMRELRSIV